MTAGTVSRIARDETCYWATVPALALALLALAAVPGTTNADWFVLWNSLAMPLPAVFWAGATNVGSTSGALALLAGWLAWRPRWTAAAILALPVGTLYTRGVKEFFAQARPGTVLDPEHFRLIGEAFRTSSFPSGHAAVAFGFAAAVALCGVADGRRWIAWIALCVATIVAFSRVAVGAHWPLDILAGGAGGWLCGAVGVWWSARWRFWETDRGVRVLALLMIVLSTSLLFEDLRYPDGVWMQYALALWGTAGATLALLRCRRSRT